MGRRHHTLPSEKIPYFLKAEDGDFHLIGTQLVRIIAHSASSGALFEQVEISGQPGDDFPVHIHARAHEVIYIMAGEVEVSLGDEVFLMKTGETAFAPAGTPHGYTLRSADARLISMNSGSNVAATYQALGALTDLRSPPESGEAVDIAAILAGVPGLDLECVTSTATGPAKPVTNKERPTGVVPFTVVKGGGEVLIGDDSIFSFLVASDNTNGEMLFIDCFSKPTPAILEHFHHEHSENFFCTGGSMTMWSDGEELKMYPGDFLHVPAMSVHSFRMDEEFSSFNGVLAPTIFEPFFRLLGNPWDGGYTFPDEPIPQRMDVFMKELKAGKLDVQPVGPPPDGSGPFGMRMGLRVAGFMFKYFFKGGRKDRP